MKLRTLGFGVAAILLGSLPVLPVHAATSAAPLRVLVTSLGGEVVVDLGRSVQMNEQFLIMGGKMLNVDASITHTDNVEASISNCKVSNGFMFGSISCMANVTRLSGGPASYGVKVVVQGQNGVSVATSIRTVTESAPAPTPTPSPTVTVTASPEPTRTPTPSATPTVSASPTQTATPTSEPTRTSSPSPKPTDSD